MEPLVKIGEKIFRLARDGTPISISLDGKGGHQVVLRCWNKEREPRPAGQRQYDWKLEIAVPNGGVLARNNLLAFEAPLENYVASETVEMPVSVQNAWS